MIYTCRYCGAKIEREQIVYGNYILQHPLWIHLREKHEEVYKLMCDFDNPNSIDDLYDYDQEELFKLIDQVRLNAERD